MTKITVLRIKATVPTYEDLRKAAEGFIYNGNERNEAILNLMDSAQINADDTVFVDKSMPESEWATVALSTLRDLLSDKNVKADVRQWFNNQGLVW